MGDKRYFTYILYSRRLNKYYVGHTNNLERRLLYHNSGYNKSTKSGLPWELVYKEGYESKEEIFQM